MACSRSVDEDVIIAIRKCSDESESEAQWSVDEEVVISTQEIHTWDLPSILTSPNTLTVRTNRARLIEHSSYFHGLLNWSFSESGMDRISIDWDVEAFLDILKCIYGCSIDVASHNFVLLYEGALYFGVGILIEKCNTWVSEVLSSTTRPQIPLDDLICIWNFGFKHVNDVLPQLCASYLARNFMWALSCKFFITVPYTLLETCIKHKDLTIDSEMHLCDALSIWLDANTGDSEGLNNTENNHVDILKQIHLSLLPIWFTAGKRRSSYISKLSVESITSVFRLINSPPTGSISVVDNFDLSDFRIRLTEYSTKMNLLSCPQITSSMLLLSVLPSLHSIDSTLGKNIKQRLIKLDSWDIDRLGDPWVSWPIFSFELVEEVDISKCRGLNLHASIACFSKSFPALKRLKAAYFLNFDIKTFRQLVYKCPMILEVDLTLDMSPFILEQESSSFLPVVDYLFEVQPIWRYKPLVSNITKLILEGRSELCDSDLLYISKLGISLQHLNIRGCTSLTDLGISTLFRRHVRLKSILVCHTSFGLNSVLVLCSLSQGYNSSAPISECMAFKLQILHISGCECIDEASLLTLLSRTPMLRSLCLRDTPLTDQALCSLSGSALEMLDVSNTMVSGAAISHVVYENPGLKFLRVKGCKNLCQRESNAATKEISRSYYHGELETAIGKTCKLEGISMGWGLSHVSMEALKPAITSLKEIDIGLGGSLGEDTLIQLPTACPNLESIVLHFQVLSDAIIINIMETLRNLRVLRLCYCIGNTSISSFKLSMPTLRKLQLARVTPWMTNKDLFILTENCPNLVELSLLGCPNLDSDTQQIISDGWPGLASLHLEECGDVTANGVSSLFDCVALEDVLLRHNGPGMQGSFILDSVSKLPLLRKVSLDLCDSLQGYFDVPSHDQTCFLRSVKMAKCKSKECGLTLQFMEPRRKAVHKETIVLEWAGKTVVRKVVKERL